MQDADVLKQLGLVLTLLYTVALAVSGYKTEKHKRQAIILITIHKDKEARAVIA